MKMKSQQALFMCLETVIKNLIFLEAPTLNALLYQGTCRTNRFGREFSQKKEEEIKQIKSTRQMKRIQLDSFVCFFGAAICWTNFKTSLYVEGYEWVCVCGYFKYNLHSTNKSPDSPSANPRLHLAIVHDNRRLRMAFHFNCVKLFWKSVSLFIWSTSPFSSPAFCFFFFYFWMLFLPFSVFVNDSFSTRPYLFEWQPFNVDFYWALYSHKLPRQMRQIKTIYGYLRSIYFSQILNALRLMKSAF